MCEISIKSYDLSTTCRLCLTKDLGMTNIFSFSTKMRNEVAVVIMKCTPVQITKEDKMPNFICQVCCTQLEKIHEFQMQAVKSEKTLRQFLQQLHGFDKQITPESSIQRPIEEPLIHNYVAETIVKCEPFEFQDEFNMDVNKKDEEPANFNKIYEEKSLKFLVKDEPTDDYHLDPTECHDDTEIILRNSNDSKLGENVEEKEIENFDTRTKINEELCPKSEIKDESMNDYFSSIFIESVYDTENALFKDDSEIICKNTKIDVGHTSENLASSCSADAKNYFDKREERNKNTSVNHSKNKKTIEMDYKFEKPYQCDVCNKCFRMSSHFKNHQRVHTGEKPYQCYVCKKSFSQTSNYKNHMRIHTGEKPFQCDVCNKCFSGSGPLRVHQRVHTGEKPYHCDVCNKSFSNSGHLRKHERVHTGEKPYQCDVCDKRYSQSGVLKIHKRTHTGETPYHCVVCDKRFSRETSLTNHKRIHTREKNLFNAEFIINVSPNQIN